MKRAFTLIELLVVIAIIAILAAILFPVFAQAKEAAKKTAALSQYKQAATGVLLYSGDSDDNAPSQGSVADGGACGAGASGQVKNPWAEWAPTTPAGADDVNCTAVDGQAWINSTQPYIKNWTMMESPGFNKRDIYTAAYMATIKNPTTSTLTMNGLLHGYSLSAVAQPSAIPMVWAGSFKNNWRGGSYSAAPVMLCPPVGGQPVPCRFNPGSGGTGVAGGAGAAFYYFTDANLVSTNHYGKGVIFTFTDSSAKFVNVNPSDSPEVGSLNQPFIQFTNGKTWNGTHTICYTGAAGTTYWPAFFRPDRNGAHGVKWQLNQCQW